MRRSPILVLALGVSVHAAASPVAAQGCAATGAIEGVAVSEAGGVIPGVQLTAPGAPAVMSDSAGRFRIPRACAGPTLLSARRLGFTATTWPVTVPAGSELRVDITLVPVAQRLEPVLVRARETPSAACLREFYVRRQHNPGHFLTREDLAPFDNGRLTDALRSRVPGMQVSASSGAIRSRVRLRGQRCAPLVWLDGAPTPAAEFDLDVLAPSGIAAVEVYSGPATIPAEFRTPFGRDGCGGVIVVWSRIGIDQWDEPRRQRERRNDDGPPLPVFTVDEVDTPARVDSTTMLLPLYPDSLFAFRVEGSALAEFVVDTTGRPVAGSVRILSASAPAFGDAVTRALSYSRFVPARKANRVVRQRMQLPFEFTIDPRS